MPDLAALRDTMIERHLRARGIRDQRILTAMAEVPREEFVAPSLVEFAYEDAPLPIEEDQTISQPYIVALMTEALELAPRDRVLEIGTGSGYAAAVLSRVAHEVYTVERHGVLADSARRRCRDLGYANVQVLEGDGTLGWAEHAPYDAIVVAAGGPEVPEPLKEQLAVGGRLVIPIGPTPRLQRLVRLRQVEPGRFEEEDLGDVRFVPLVGEEGWTEAGERARRRPAAQTLAGRIAAAAEPIPAIDEIDLAPLLARIGDSRLVLLGEASHGTSEFYRMRARITRDLIERKGFRVVAVEADWPDAARIDRYVRETPGEPSREAAFTRFPTWMWANEEVLDFVEWLRLHNLDRPHDDRAGFFGLDLYSLYGSIAAVLQYLDSVDPEAAQVARSRYGCLTPWEGDPATYGAAAVAGRYRDCEEQVVATLQDLLAKRLQYASRDGHRFLDAMQSARLIANAERYYRTMYYGSRASWNLRDTHMFETLTGLVDQPELGGKAVVWEHNSHVGDAAATEMGARGEHNVGQLTRQRFGAGAYLVGFGTDHGTVAAAHDWGDAMQVMTVRPAHPKSYERLCHDARHPGFLLPLRARRAEPLGQELMEPRLERAIGVIYRPQTEMQSHYFQAILPQQFDEYAWFDATRAVTPLERRPLEEGMPETFPFGL